MESLQEAIKERVPRIASSFTIIVFIYLIVYLTLPIAYTTSYVIPGIGIASGILIGVIALAIVVILAIKITGDLRFLIDAGSAYIVDKQLIEASEGKRNQFKKALSDIGFAISTVLFITLIAPVLVIIPGIGVFAIFLPFLVVLFLIAFTWNAAAFIYQEIKNASQHLAEDLAQRIK